MHERSVNTYWKAETILLHCFSRCKNCAS